MHQINTHVPFQWNPRIMKFHGFFGNSDVIYPLYPGGCSAPRTSVKRSPLMQRRSATRQAVDEPPTAALRIDTACPDSETLVVTPIGEADICTALELAQALRDALVTDRPYVVVTLDHLTFMDASTLGVLVAARARTAAAGKALRVRCRTARNRRLFTITGLEGLLE